jgi:hypothetical protein
MITVMFTVKIVDLVTSELIHYTLLAQHFRALKLSITHEGEGIMGSQYK